MTERSARVTPFIMLCLVGFLAFFSSYMRIPVLPLYASSLGASPAKIGIINGAFMLTTGLCSIPAGLLADRIGRKPPIFFGALAVGLSSFLVSRCQMPMQMAGAYLLFGAGLAAFAPGMLSLLADVMPTERLGQGYGWYTTAIYTAMTLGPATGGFLAKHLGLREVFMVSGSLSLLVALLILVAVPRGSSRHRSELGAILTSSIALLHNRFLCACLLATIGSCIGFGVFLSFLPLAGLARGLDSSHVGIVLAAQALTNVVFRIPIGIYADRVARHWVVAAGLPFQGVAIAFLGHAVTLPQMVAAAIVLGIGMALTYTAIGALIAEQVPVLQRGLAMGMYNSCIYLGMMAGSTLMGMALNRTSYPFVFTLSGSVSLLAMGIFILLLRNASPRNEAI